mgnify:CR=1 FL=1
MDFLEDTTLGPNQAARLQTVWDLVKDDYDRRRPPQCLDRLTINMFSKEGSTRAVFPCLKAKANEARHVLPSILMLCRRWHDPGSAYYVNRLACVALRCRFYAICECAKHVLPPDAATAGGTCIKDFLRHYSLLAEEAVTHNRLRWQVTIKFHYLAHVVDDIHYMNPKYVSTYTPESFIGKLAVVAHSATFGKPGYALGRFLMAKMQTMMSVRLSR